MKSTNYYNTLIEVAEDCPVETAEIPPTKGSKKSVATYQYEMVSQNPYEYTSDEVLFSVFATRKEFAQTEWDEERKIYFSKGQPCFRASPLPKRYGWGIHSNADGKIALIDCNSTEYQALLADETVKKTKAMRSKRA